MITPAGDIKDWTIPWLFQSLRSEKKSGTVVFARDTAVLKVYFKEGDILFASSNLIEDRLGEYLLRTGKITKAQFDKSSETVISTGKRLGAVLFEMGALTSHDLVAHVKLQVKEIILRLFSWRDGHYIFDNGPLPISEIIPLQMSTGDLIIEGVRDLDWKSVRKSLPPLPTVMRPAADPSHLFQSAHLDSDQRAVFSLIDGKKSIEELCTLSGIGDFNTLKAIFALIALRMTEAGEIKSDEEMKFAREAVRDAISSNAKKEADTKKEAEVEQETASAEVTKKLILHAYESLELQNHYEVLGVGKSATEQEIKKAYFHYAKLYHPDRHFDTEMSDMKDKLEALFARIHDAYETLSTPIKRNKYNIELTTGVKKHHTTTAAQRPATDNKSAAQVQFNEGMKRFNVGNYWGADEAFQWAMRLDPANAEYVFRRGVTLSRVPRRGHEAEEYYEKAIELSPKKVEYHMELGNFYLKAGLKAKAKGIFQNALSLDPANDKVIEAIKKADSK